VVCTRCDHTFFFWYISCTTQRSQGNFLTLLINVLFYFLSILSAPFWNHLTATHELPQEQNRWRYLVLGMLSKTLHVCRNTRYYSSTTIAQPLWKLPLSITFSYLALVLYQKLICLSKRQEIRQFKHFVIENTV